MDLTSRAESRCPVAANGSCWTRTRDFGIMLPHHSPGHVRNADTTALPGSPDPDGGTHSRRRAVNAKLTSPTSPGWAGQLYTTTTNPCRHEIGINPPTGSRTGRMSYSNQLVANCSPGARFVRFSLSNSSSLTSPISCLIPSVTQQFSNPRLTPFSCATLPSASARR